MHSEAGRVSPVSPLSLSPLPSPGSHNRDEMTFAQRSSIKRKIQLIITHAHKKMMDSDLEGAIQLFQKAEQACLDLLGPEEEMRGEIHHSLAYCHDKLGQTTLCKLHLGMALENRKTNIGIVDPDMASTMAYIATVASQEADFDKAVFFSRQALSTWEQCEEPLTEEVLQTTMLLGYASRCSNKVPTALDQAEAIYMDLAAKLRKQIDHTAVVPTSPKAAKPSTTVKTTMHWLSECIQCLGEVQMESGRYKDAIHTLQDAFREACNANHFNPMQILPKLEPPGEGHESTLPNEKAEPARGAPPSILVVLKLNLANALLCMQRVKEAQQEVLVASGMYDAAFPAKVNQLGADLLQTQATVLFRMGIDRWEEAVQLFEQAVTLAAALDTADARHLRVHCLRNLAFLRIEMAKEGTTTRRENLERAQECLNDALKATNGLFGLKSREVAMAYAHLGWVENQLEWFEQSLSHYESALSVAGQISGYRSVFYADNLLDTAHAYVNLGKFDQAYKVSNQADSIYSTVVGKKYPLRPQVQTFVEYVKIGELPPQIRLLEGNDRQPRFN